MFNESSFLFGSYRVETYNYRMNQKPARVSTDKLFAQESLSFKDVPHQSKLFLDFQANSSKVNKFYPEKQTALKEYAAQILENFQVDRKKLCDALSEINKSFDAATGVFENIELLRENNCLAIVTGQQAGLFSGAIYTIYKALSAVKLAEDLRKQNVKAVPVFWIAEEDHDFDEVKKTFVLNNEGKLSESKNTPRNYEENMPVGLVKLDETITADIEDLFINLPCTEFSEQIKLLLSASYQPGETYSTAFAKFLNKLFGDYGLILISPLNEKLKRLCAPIFAETIEKTDSIIAALLERNNQLEKENYQPQVLVGKDSFPFFYQNEKGERQTLRLDLETGKIKVQQSKVEFDKSQLIEIARNSPQSLSPNALLRPVVQDYLLPTLVYFGGAAEIAYFAQNSAVYQILNRPVTPIRHRASLTIIERRHARTLEKYNLNFTDLFDGEEKITAEIVEKFINQSTAQVFAEVEENINAQLNRLNQSLTADAPTLAANLINRRKKILWHIAALRKKYHRAEMLNNEIVQRRIDALFTTLLPNRALQERTLNVNFFLNLHGTNFIEWIYQAIEPDEKEHQILYL